MSDRYGNTELRYTDHLGRFRFPDLAAGTYKLTVRHEGIQPSSETVTLTADEDLLGDELRFAGGRPFVVWVQDEGGSPVAEALVSASHEGGHASTRTNKEGKADLTVQGAIHNLAVWPPQNQYLKVEPLKNLPATQHEARFALKRAATITGRVVLEDGKPFAKAILEVWVGGKKQNTVAADGEGRFTATVPPGTTVDLVFYGVQKGNVWSRDANHTGELKGVAAGAKDVVFRVRKVTMDRSLVVRVLGPDGSPIEGALVFANPVPFRRDRRIPKTDAKGLVELADLPARKLKIGVSTGFGALRELVLPKYVEVEPRGQEIVLRLLKGMEFTGLVLMPDGTPADRAIVHAFAEERMYESTATDKDGRFILFLPPDPDLRFRIVAALRTEDGKNLHGWLEDVAPATGEVRLKLKKPR